MEFFFLSRTRYILRRKSFVDRNEATCSHKKFKLVHKHGQKALEVKIQKTIFTCITSTNKQKFHSVLI